MHHGILSSSKERWNYEIFGKLGVLRIYNRRRGHTFSGRDKLYILPHVWILVYTTYMYISNCACRYSISLKKENKKEQILGDRERLNSGDGHLSREKDYAAYGYSNSNSPWIFFQFSLVSRGIKSILHNVCDPDSKEKCRVWASLVYIVESQAPQSYNGKTPCQKTKNFSQ